MRRMYALADGELLPASPLTLPPDMRAALDAWMDEHGIGSLTLQIGVEPTVEWFVAVPGERLKLFEREWKARSMESSQRGRYGDQVVVGRVATVAREAPGGGTWDH